MIQNITVEFISLILFHYPIHVSPEKEKQQKTFFSKLSDPGANIKISVPGGTLNGKCRNSLARTSFYCPRELQKSLDLSNNIYYISSS